MIGADRLRIVHLASQPVAKQFQACRRKPAFSPDCQPAAVTIYPRSTNQIANPIEVRKMSTYQSAIRPALRQFALFAVMLASAAIAWPVTGANSDPGPWIWQNPLPQGNDLRGASFI